MRKFLFTISLILIAKIACSTDLFWQVNPYDFQHSMSVTASIYIDDVEQQNEMLELAAFCGDDLRGSALPRVSDITGKLIYSITIYGHEDAEILNFKFYDHSSNSVSELVCLQTLEFSINGIVGDANYPYIINFNEPNPIFTGSGDWNSLSNWENSKLPKATDDVIIDGDAFISGNVTVNSLVINESKSLTIQDGGILSVTSTLTNDDYNALIIEEGGQIFQTNANVAATFMNEIVVPTGTWEEDDITGWQFVSSPVENVSTGDFVPDNGDYDLYMYDGTQELQWVNFKQMGSQLYDFITNPFDNGWTSIDANGDGMNWNYQPRSRYVYSVSFDNVLWDIFAENYFVSPLITINNGTKLNLKMRCTDNEYYPETFKILLSEGSNSSIADFNIEVDDITVTNTSFQSLSYDLSDYAGKSVYVAFYHYVAPENFGSGQLIIDDVEFVNDNSFEKGRGYLVSYQNEGNIAEFKGNLNYLAEGESYQISLKHYADNLAQFNLVGNPFPFDVNWKTDININNVYDGFATLDAINGGYIYNYDGIIKVGEGFMIKTLEGTDNYISFSKGAAKSYRDESNTINVTASNGKASDNVIIRFDDKQTSGFPKLRNFNDKIANIYMKDNNVNYAIMNYDNDVKEIPLYFDAKEMGVYTISTNINGEFDNVILVDRITGVETNLLLEDYTFTSRSNDDKERFILKLAQSSQPAAHSNFAYVNNGDIVIFDIEGDAQIRIVDALGRCIYNGECSDAASHVSTNGFANGVYIIEKIDDKGIKVQKIIL